MIGHFSLRESKREIRERWKRGMGRGGSVFLCMYMQLTPIKLVIVALVSVKYRMFMEENHTLTHFRLMGMLHELHLGTTVKVKYVTFLQLVGVVFGILESKFIAP